MTKTELLELLLVERFMPLPPPPAQAPAPDEVYAPQIAYDTKAVQAARRRTLLEATDDAAVLVKRRGIYVVPRSAA